MVKISVIVPVYNMEKYLQQCLNTIFEQTLQDIEVICVNDGSLDSSLDILHENAVVHGNLRIINQENHGVGYARNVGIKSATGEFIAFMDPDDYYLERNTLEILYSKAKENNVKICGGSLCEDHRDGEYIKKKFEGIYTKYVFEEEGLVQYRDYQFDFGYYRFIFERNLLLDNNIYFPEYIRFQDPPFFVKAMIIAKEFYAVKNFTYCYRFGHQNLIWNEKRICDLIRGHRDDIKMSAEAGLKELHLLSIYRLAIISRGCILAGLEQHSHKMLELLYETEGYINKEWTESYEVKSIYDGLFHMAEELDETKVKLKKCRQNIKKSNAKVKEAEKKFNEIINSETFKVGKMIMFIPHKLKIFFKK